MERFLVVTVWVLGGLVGAAAAQDEGNWHDRVAIDDDRFEFLKGLEGTWAGKMDEDTENIIEFRLTAGGTAIEERELVGTPMEMVTLYHMDGPDLVATHYCMLGNQPRLTASKEVIDDTLSFSCAGTPTNATSHDAEHVHGWTMRLDGQGRLLYDSELTKEGKVSETVSLVLTRRPEKTRR